jgi:hypothetical protein
MSSMMGAPAQGGPPVFPADIPKPPFHDRG